MEVSEEVKENLRVDIGEDNLQCTQSEIFFSTSSWADQNLFNIYFNLWLHLRDNVKRYFIIRRRCCPLNRVN